MILQDNNLYTGHDNWGGRSFANAYDSNDPVYVSSAHVLLRFDLPSLSLSDPDDIVAATLTLHASSSTGSTLQLYRLLESWEEGTGSGASSVYASETGGTGGTGFGPQDGACDWYDRYHGSTAWSVPGAVGGGSSLADPSAVYTVTAEHTILMDVTQDLRYWYANGTNSLNYGWVITSQDTDGEWPAGIRFHSDDYIYPSYQPALAIDYVPEPSAFVVWSLVGALGISVAWWRRRAA
ncbi:MAG TPA: DNRLRE domain-containing protein [Thermoguttaceae bacterium]|nr:DNRLRE domain-containing protein [Thermoleophilia bacterium]HUT88438.1 DNRLRE domain-containing protein [Thermoguttaceae bacterium]